ncbi:MAG TPA: sugar ABC transporter permease, partial [Acidimicrobiales bacterium]|nr:sugar ABC transporter permease [Acidimicrobiales bacterium]
LDNRLVLYALVLIVLWEFTGYNMMIYITSLTSISREVLEAAEIDGASQWTIVRRVKLPLLRRTIIFTLVLAIIGTLQLFNEPQILSHLTPYITSNYTPNLDIYNEAFSFGNIPLAAAESLVLAVITVAASLVFFRLVARRGQRTAVRGWRGRPLLGRSRPRMAALEERSPK